MQTDALSDVLRVVRLSGAMFFRLHLSAPYSLGALPDPMLRAAFAPDADHVLPFHLITKGPIWFTVEGEPPIRLDEGDLIVIPHGTNHSVSDCPGNAITSVTMLQEHVAGFPPTLTWGGPGPQSHALCGFFTCQGRLFNPLMEALPRVLVVRKDAARTPWIVSTLQRTYNETLEDRRGGAALIERLTALLFMEIVQLHLEGSSAEGWLAALNDPTVGKVLQLMHDQPARAWTVDDLAKRAGVSRSVLAERFAGAVGMSPIRYLTGWRMELAATKLLESGDSIAEIAADVGYETESSFSKAFKRYVGQPPAGWRTAQLAATPVAPPST